MSNNPREQLASLLTRSRREAGYGTQAAFARAAHISRPAISRAENADHPVPSPQVLDGYAKLTSADREELDELVKRATGGTPEWFMSYRRAETEATMLRLWGPFIVPGLLQIRPYAHAVVAASVRDPARLSELVTARMERQPVLERVPVVAVLSTRVLQVKIGTPVIMADQCGWLAELAERPNVSFHIVAEENTGTWGTLDVATKGSLATVCLSTGLQDVPSTEPETVDNAMQAFERLLGLAISRDKSLDFIRKRQTEWKAQI